jgi:hypothetical protein
MGLLTTAQDTIVQIRKPSKLRNNGDGIKEYTDFLPTLYSEYKFSEYRTGYWKIVENDSVLGWVPTANIIVTPTLEHIIFLDRKRLMVEKYGAADGERIAMGQVWIGMKKSMLLDSKGYPPQHNLLITKNGSKTEQWLYENLEIFVARDTIVRIYTE